MARVLEVNSQSWTLKSFCVPFFAAVLYVRLILSRYYHDFSRTGQIRACGGASVNVLRGAHYRARVTRHRNSTRRHWRANAQITSAIVANFGFTLITATLRGELQTRTRYGYLGGRCNLSHRGRKPQV